MAQLDSLMRGDDLLAESGTRDMPKVTEHGNRGTEPEEDG